MSTGRGEVDGDLWQPPDHPFPAAPTIHGDMEDLAEEVTATINATVHFKCEATGQPVPTVSWLWNDVPIVASPRHQLLEGGTVLQVGVPLSRAAVPGGDTADAGQRGWDTLPSQVLPSVEVPLGAPAAPWLVAAIDRALLALCRWPWWRWVTLAATRVWPRTWLAQPRNTSPSPWRIRHPQQLLPRPAKPSSPW